MRRIKSYNLALGALLLTLLTAGAPFTIAQEVTILPPDDLKIAIEQKAKQLDEVTKQLEQAQGELTDATVQGKTLKAEVSRIDDTVQKVNLNIKVSEITIDKLSLEVQSLQNDIRAKERSAALKRDTVAQLLVTYQQSENQSLLLSFMNGETIAQSLSEIQSISDLNSGLLREVDELGQLKQELAERLEQVSGKKNSVEKESINLKAKKSIAQDQLTTRQQLLAETKNKEENYKKLVSDLEKQQQSISDEISDIEDALRIKYGTDSLPMTRPGVLASPIPGGMITQLYGKTKDAKKLYKSGFHNGMDFGVPVGTPILAADDGVVFIAAYNGARLQYGRYILIKHANGLLTLYAHLSRQSVKTGDKVSRGETIGYSGNTGYTVGRGHLHFGVYYEPESCNITRSGRSDCMQLKNIGSAPAVPIGVTVDPTDYL